MKEILITQGKVAFVDDEDFDRISQFNWYAMKSKNGYYARRVIGFNDKWQSQYEMMHHTVFGDHVLRDHIDRNGLNNCRSNLRPCSNSQNMGNSGPRKAGYKGVYRHHRKWVSYIRGANSKTKYLGSFETQQEAAKAYDAAAKEKWGEFAWLNFPDTPRTAILPTIGPAVPDPIPEVAPVRDILGMYWAYTTPEGEVIPSTIRGKQSDALVALRRTTTGHRHDLDKCRLISVYVCEAEGQREDWIKATTV